jgi:hypothetical protein
MELERYAALSIPERRTIAAQGSEQRALSTAKTRLVERSFRAKMDMLLDCERMPNFVVPQLCENVTRCTVIEHEGSICTACALVTVYRTRKYSSIWLLGFATEMPHMNRPSRHLL